MATELALIDAFLSAFPNAAEGRGVRLGPGDDCAVLTGARADTCVTTDAVVEGVHFTRPRFSLEDVGHKALAVNLSDLAAMGARPRWFVCAIGAPALETGDARRLGRGMAALAREHPIALVGGNFTSAPALSLTLTVAGEVPPRRALTRAGARPGDALYVSGTLGDARAGLATRARGPAATVRQRRPLPRVSLGLAVAPYASAAIDISDGFARDLGHLCAASGVGAEVSLHTLPVGPLARRLAAGPAEALGWALGGGEDYELLLAVPPRHQLAFVRACHRARTPVARVGGFTRSRAVYLLDQGGERVSAPAGFDHFAV